MQPTRPSIAKDRRPVSATRFAHTTFGNGGILTPRSPSVNVAFFFLLFLLGLLAEF